MDASYYNLMIGGRCRVRLCQEPLYRAGCCRTHYAREKLKSDVEYVSLAHFTTYFVYVVLAANGLVKIGISTEPEKRFITLQTSSPLSLELLGYIPASPKIEKLLHEALGSARSHGEWFRPTDAVNSAVKAICGKDWDLLEAVLGIEKSAVDG